MVNAKNTKMRGDTKGNLRTTHLMFKYRIYPNRIQKEILEHHIELCRQTYNFLLRYCQDKYKETKKTTTWFDMNRLITNLKKHNPQLYQLYSANLLNVSKRVNDAYTNFYARRRAKLKAGLPRFKKHRRYRSITYITKNFKLDTKLHLTRIGDLRIILHREIKGIIKTLTIKKNASGKWFAIFSCEVESQPMEKPFEVVGIDVGLNSLATLSDGTKIENPQHYRSEERRLARLQRSVSRKVKGSNNRKKAQLKVARLHEKIQNRRNDFLHKVSRQIALTYQNIYVENLKITNMIQNHHLSKSIGDASWGRFIQMISYKVESTGGKLIKVDPKNTSQICSGCGEIVAKNLSIRVHRCHTCGLELDRDHNAALNILARGLEIGRVPPEFKPDGEMIPTQFPRIAQVASMKQEAHPYGGVAHE